MFRGYPPQAVEPVTGTALLVVLPGRMASGCTSVDAAASATVQQIPAVTTFHTD